MIIISNISFDKFTDCSDREKHSEEKPRKTFFFLSFFTTFGQFQGLQGFLGQPDIMLD